MRPLVLISLSYCKTGTYNQDISVLFSRVSKMIPLVPVSPTASDRDTQMCRYNWHYEKTMGIQANEHQRLVGRMV